jgi:WD40 repeat protein
MRDTEQFIEKFAWAIEHNPAHIYLSALPFTPPNSLISTYFLKTLPNILHLSVDATEEPQPVMTAAVSGELIAVVFANALLKVFNLDHEGAEIFHAQVDPISLKSDGTLTPGYCIAISGDGKMVALGHDNCYVWHLDSGGIRRIVLAQDIVGHTTCLAFSNDGEHIVTGFSHGDLHEWVINSGMKGRPLLWPSDIDGPKRKMVITAVYAQTDHRILSGSMMSSGPPQFHIWSRNGDCTFSYLLSELHLFPLLLSSHWLISIGYDAYNQWWRIQDPFTGKLQFKCGPVPRGYSGCTRRKDGLDLFMKLPILAVSSDGKLAAFSTSDFHLPLFIWDVHDNIKLAELVGHTDYLTSVAFAASHGKSKYRLVTTSLDGTIRLWDLDQLFKPKEDQHPMTSWRICLEADGRYFHRGYSVQNGNGECLFWLPDSCPIRHPLNTLVIGRCAELDMTDFVYGKDWTKCRGSEANDEVSEVDK